MAGTMVEFASNGGRTAGYLATPTGGKGPGVLVLQEWWGLVGHIKSVCDRFAAEGFTALAPDMYHGKTASEPDGAGKLFMALNIGQAEKDLRGAATHLQTHSSTTKIGTVGFCMGGQLALYAATLNPSVALTNGPSTPINSAARGATVTVQGHGFSGGSTITNVKLNTTGMSTTPALPFSLSMS